MMHNAKDTSPRLARVLRSLRRSKNGLTTRQIILRARVCAVSACVAELRCSGHKIKCVCEGFGRYRYKLEM